MPGPGMNSISCPLGQNFLGKCVNFLPDRFSSNTTTTRQAIFPYSCSSSAVMVLAVYCVVGKFT